MKFYYDLVYNVKKKMHSLSEKSDYVAEKLIYA